MSNAVRHFAFATFLALTQACTPSSHQTSNANLLLEFPAPSSHRHHTHLPDLEALLGPNIPGGANLISGHAFGEAKLTFPMAHLDVSQAVGWKQHSNALSLEYINDLARLNDSNIRWYVRNFRPDIPRYPVDPFLAEKRLELRRAWLQRLNQTATPIELARLDRLHFEADLDALKAMLRREILSDESEIAKGSVDSLFMNPIWNSQTSQSEEALRNMLLQMAPVQGEGYFLQLRRKIKDHLEKKSVQIRNEWIEFFTVPERLDAYLRTFKSPFLKAPTPETTAALARLDSEVNIFSEWMIAHKDELSRSPELEDETRRESQLIVKYQTAGITGSPSEVYAFGDRKFQELDQEIKKLSKTSKKASRLEQEILTLPPIQSSEQMIEAFLAMSDRLDDLLRRKKILTIPQDRITLIECNVPQFPYKEGRPFCSNLVPSMNADNFLSHTQISSGVARPRVIFPAFEYLRDKAPRLLKPEVAFPILAHEGRPGHELQFRSFARGESTLARSLLSQQRLSVEGWALYAEKLVEEALGEISTEFQLEFLRLRQWRAARVTLESQLYRNGMTKEAAIDFLVKNVGLDVSTATDEVVTRYLDRDFPSDASYLYGYELLLQLRNRLQTELGPEFDLMRFNDAVIKMGFLAPDRIYELVKAEMLNVRD